jgi:hypothetical protein
VNAQQLPRPLAASLAVIASIRSSGKLDQAQRIGRASVDLNDRVTEQMRTLITGSPVCHDEESLQAAVYADRAWEALIFATESGTLLSAHSSFTRLSC